MGSTRSGGRGTSGRRAHRLASSTRALEGRKAIENPYYSPETQGPNELVDLDDFVLEEGYTLRDCELAYATFGELNDAKDNAILVTTWYSGTHQIFRHVYISP
jgi:homoserine O-acetyltransferase/O-succinyltransferase